MLSLLWDKGNETETKNTSSTDVAKIVLQTSYSHVAQKAHDSNKWKTVSGKKKLLNKKKIEILFKL